MKIRLLKPRSVEGVSRFNQANDAGRRRLSGRVNCEGVSLRARSLAAANLAEINTLFGSTQNAPRSVPIAPCSPPR